MPPVHKAKRVSSGRRGPISMVSPTSPFALACKSVAIVPAEACVRTRLQPLACCGLPSVLSTLDTISVNSRAGQDMGQNYKVVHRPMKLFETVELKSMIRDETILSLALAGPNAIFSCFLPYPVRFDALSVLVVHTKTSEETHFCMNGLMDTISVKICATVTYMCQKQNNTAFRCGSQLALQATYWTGYLSLARTKPLSNHRLFRASCELAHLIIKFLQNPPI